MHEPSSWGLPTLLRCSEKSTALFSESKQQKNTSWKLSPHFQRFQITRTFELRVATTANGKQTLAQKSSDFERECNRTFQLSTNHCYFLKIWKYAFYLRRPPAWQDHNNEKQRTARSSTVTVNSSTSQVQTEHEQTLSTWLLTVEDGGAALLDASREWQRRRRRSERTGIARNSGACWTPARTGAAKIYESEKTE